MERNVAHPNHFVQRSEAGLARRPAKPAWFAGATAALCLGCSLGSYQVVRHDAHGGALTLQGQYEHARYEAVKYIKNECGGTYLIVAEYIGDVEGAEQTDPGPRKHVILYECRSAQDDSRTTVDRETENMGDY